MGTLDFDNAVKLVADDVASVRRCDVFRLLDTYSEDLDCLSNWLRSKRPDSATEISECVKELKGG